MRLVILDLSVEEAADQRILRNILNAVGPEPLAPYIKHQDRPDVGAMPSPPPTDQPIVYPGPPPALLPVAEPQPDPAVIFAKQEVASPAPLPLAQPVAAAEPISIAPAAALPSSTATAPVVASPAAMPVPAAPTAIVPAVPAASPAGTAPEIDSRGLPWDHRIHAGTKAKNKDGSWRQKRETEAWIKANPGLTWQQHVDTIEAEVRAVMGLPPVVSEQPPAPPVPTHPTSVVGTAVAPAPTAASPAEFGPLMMKVQEATLGGHVASDWIMQRANHYGLQTLTSMMLRADVVQAIWSDLARVAPSVFAA